MRKWIYLVPFLSAPGRSINHYPCLHICSKYCNTFTVKVTLGLVPTSAIIFIALDFWSDKFYRTDGNIIAIILKNYCYILVWYIRAIIVIYRSEILLWYAKSEEYRPWSLIFYWVCKVLFDFYSKKSIFM